MREHEAATCRACEHPPADGYRRHWMTASQGPWHVIADGSDLMARLPRQAHYVTVLAYQPGADGAPAHYRGPLYAEWDGQDPAAVLAEVRTCLQLPATAYELPLEALRLWHSGGRGYHLTLPAVVIGAEAGHPQLPRIYTAMIAELFPPKMAPTLDRGVYSGGMGRMWRLPNRRRANGRYKVPLAMREVLHRTSAELEALTQRPRPGRYWPDEAELSPCAALAALYLETAAEIQDAPLTPAAAPSASAKLTPGHRHAYLVSIAGSMRRRGMRAEAIEAALRIENEARYEPPKSEAEIRAIARSMERYPPASERHAPMDGDRRPLLGARYLAREVRHG